MGNGTQQSTQLVERPTIRQTATEATVAGTRAVDDDLLEQLRRGDEDAFVGLIDRYAHALLRLAMVYVSSQTVAEEVVQETWLAVLTGLNRFRGESSLKTWIFHILTNRAKTRARREGRTLPFSSLETLDIDLSEPEGDPDRFLPTDQQCSGHWVSFPSPWQEMPEERLLSQETRRCLERGIASLPINQREIIILRDIEGWTAQETCRRLGISEVNQRVLLHRARSKMRTHLERYFEEE